MDATDETFFFYDLEGFRVPMQDRHINMLVEKDVVVVATFFATPNCRFFLVLDQPAQVLGAIGMGGAKLLDCDQLAVKLLDRVCNPPLVLELHELGS